MHGIVSPAYGRYNHPTAVVLMFGKQLAALSVWPGLDLVPFTTVRPGSPPALAAPSGV